MRLISNDNCVDIPYENCAVITEEFISDGMKYQITAIFHNCKKRMGLYTYKATALRIMEDMRADAKAGHHEFIFPDDKP